MKYNTMFVLIVISDLLVAVVAGLTIFYGFEIPLLTKVSNATGLGTIIISLIVYTLFLTISSLGLYRLKKSNM